MNMEVTIHHLGRIQFEATARGHRVVCDQPAANGGADAAMSQPELLLASLGTCAAYYAVEYLKAHSIPTAELEIKVSAEKVLQPARLDKFRIEVAIPALDTRHQEGLVRAVHKCLIHNTLTHPPTIETVVRTLAAV
jgi:uncharacterized OsmC-like protein